jgi:hypothetical protein
MRRKFAEKNSFTSPINRKNNQLGGKLAGGASLAALGAGWRHCRPKGLLRQSLQTHIHLNFQDAEPRPALKINGKYCGHKLPPN